MGTPDIRPSQNGRGSDAWSSSWTHLRVDRRSAGYCRVTFDHPPINTITATTVAELAELVGLIEQDPDLNVVVFDSANPDFYLAHYDVENDPSRTAALPAGPTGMPAWLDLLVRLSRAPVRQHRLDPRTRPRRRKRVRAGLRPAVRLTREHAARPVRGRQRAWSPGAARWPDSPAWSVAAARSRSSSSPTISTGPRAEQYGYVNRVDRRRPARRRGRSRSPHDSRVSTTTRSRARSPTSTG